MEELADFLNEISKGYDKPEMFFSTDSGFNNDLLLKKIEEKGFVPICVPKDNHCITYKDKTLKIKELKIYFENKEQKYLSKNPDETSFCWRIKANYRMHQREVIFIVFRLKGSKKVSVVFCFDIHAQAKTIRRHWFARTMIDWVSPNSFFD